MTATRTAPEVRDGERTASWGIGAAAVCATAAFLVLLIPGLRHWFVLPVVLCGVLVAPDAVDWARGRLDTFDPRAVLGVVGVHFFFLAPLLHVALDYWPRYVPPSADWRDALGRMALLNVAGLLLYRTTVGPVAGRGPDAGTGRVAPPVDVARLRAIGTAVVVVSLLAFLWVVARFDGPTGYLSSLADDRDELTGLGSILLVAGLFPLIVFVLVLVRHRDHLRDHPRTTAALVAALGVAQLVVGGLNGSRAHTVWPVLLAIGMCHLLVARVRRRTLVAVFLAGLAFMYVYGFYKNVGSAALGLLTGATSTAELSAETGRDVPLLLLGDLGRADVQALTLQRQREGTAAVGNGITYVGDLAFLVPARVLPVRPPDKVEVGTDVLHGEGAYDSGLRTSQVFGLAGEAVLNFGAAGAVLSFAALGGFVRVAGRIHRRALDAGSLPWPGPLGPGLLAAVLPVSVLLVLGSDLGNLAWFLVNHVVVLAAIVFASRRRTA